MWSFYSKIMKKTTPYKSSSAEEVDTYLKEPLQQPTADIFSYWKNNQTFPHLKKLAVKFLCVPPATVFSERLFSSAGIVCDQKRSRLDPERVRMLVFLNKNLKLSSK